MRYGGFGQGFGSVGERSRVLTPSSLVYLTNVSAAGDMFFSAARWWFIPQFSRGDFGIVDEKRGASRRKTKEERRDKSRCGGLVHDGDVISVQQVFSVYDIVYPSRSVVRSQNVEKT